MMGQDPVATTARAVTDSNRSCRDASPSLSGLKYRACCDPWMPRRLIGIESPVTKCTTPFGLHRIEPRNRPTRSPRGRKNRRRVDSEAVTEAALKSVPSWRKIGKSRSAESRQAMRD